MSKQTEREQCCPIGTPASKIIAYVENLMEFSRQMANPKDFVAPPPLKKKSEEERSQCLVAKGQAGSNKRVKNDTEAVAALPNAANESSDRVPIPVPLSSSSPKAKHSSGPLLVESIIRERLSTFPTVIIQAKSESSFSYCIPQWNWLKSLDAAATSGTMSTIWEFYQKVVTTASVLAQIANAFEFGLSVDEAQVRSVCREMEIGASAEEQKGRRSMVALHMIPYVSGIFSKELEKQGHCNLGKVSQPLQNEQEVQKRNEAVEWIMRTAKRVNYSAETVHLGVYILDVYSTSKESDMTACPWRLLGITALHIASKMEETRRVHLTKLLTLSSVNFSDKDVCWLERDIVDKLKFDLCPPSAPLIASLVIYGGSLQFPNVNMRKLTLDLTLGILYKSLESHKLTFISSGDKAKAALETAVEFLYHQFKHWSNKNMSAYDVATNVPGQAVGDFALDMCTQVFSQRFYKLENKAVPMFPTDLCCNSSQEKI